MRRIVTFDEYMEDMSDEEYGRLQNKYCEMSTIEQYEWLNYIDEFLEIENLDEYFKGILEIIDKIWHNNSNLLTSEFRDFVDELVDNETAMIYLMGYILKKSNERKDWLKPIKTAKVNKGEKYGI